MHEIEYSADKTAYDLYCKAVKRVFNDVPPEVLLSPVMMMFDLFYKFAGGSSSSHPHPHARIVRIVHDYFSPGLAAKTEVALKDPQLLPQVFPVPAL